MTEITGYADVVFRNKKTNKIKHMTFKNLQTDAFKDMFRQQ